MPSSFDALHDETRPLRLLDGQGDPLQEPGRAVTGLVLAILALVVPVLVIAAL